MNIYYIWVIHYRLVRHFHYIKFNDIDKWQMINDKNYKFNQEKLLNLLNFQHLINFQN